MNTWKKEFMNVQRTCKVYLKQIEISKYVQPGASVTDYSTIMGAPAFRSCRVQGFEYFPY
jgi:hypothetical protein